MTATRLSTEQDGEHTILGEGEGDMVVRGSVMRSGSGDVWWQRVGELGKDVWSCFAKCVVPVRLAREECDEALMAGVSMVE